MNKLWPVNKLSDDFDQLSQDAKVKQIQLIVEQFVCVNMLDLTNLNSVSVQTAVEWIAAAQAYSIKTVVVSPMEELQSKIVAEYPETLWDHIKAKLRLKHKTRKIRLREYTLYPEYRITPEQFGKPLFYYRLDNV